MGTYLGPVILAVLALTAPSLAESKCKAGCHHRGHGATNNAFAYIEGNTYTYSVEGTTTTSLTGTKGDGIKLTLKATAELSVQSNCAQYLKLSGVTITGSDGKKYDNLKDLEKYPLRFNFHDGHVDAELCTVEDDSQSALNVKRAVLSLFQVAASQSFSSNVQHEVDVFGSCPTEFSFSKDGDTLIVRKERNLNRCAYREDFRSDMLSVGYAGGSPLQNTPLMASSMKVTQRIKDKILESAESIEEYFYRPLSNRDAGAKTIVETKIKLTSTVKKGPASTAVTLQRSILFEVPHVTTIPGNADAISKVMHKAHENMKTTVGETSARDFGDVVQVLRHSTKDDILKAFKETHHKKMFIEALMRTGTGDAVQAGAELIKQKEIKDGAEKVWYLSLGFVRHATPGSLAAVASLIDGSSSRGLILGAGALAGRYCREHSCDNKSEYNTLISKLAAPLGSNCKPKDRADENKIIASLKAIQNVHHLNDATAKIVSVCTSETSLPTRIRVFALESFHGDACIPKLKETALNVLKNSEEDSEIRIKAYLALVDCPSGSVANAIKELIDNEPSNQVGAFIVSHLRNLRASANPDRESAKAHLGNIKPIKRFPNDLRKFSRNFEVSTLVDLLNIGASAESNVIFSQRSFVPRSASLNLTTDIFGHSVNLFELGIRAENVDRVLEHIFGPKGYVRSNNVKDIFSDGKDKLVTLAEKVSSRFAKATRGKRSVSRDQINAVSKKVSLGPKEFDAELDIDLSVRVFGLESVWLNYQGGQNLSPESIVDKLFDSVDSGIEKAKKFNYDIQKHYQFLDTDLTYPTGLGFPLKLSAIGNAAIHLTLDGQLDLHAILKDPKNAEAKLHIVPSAAVEINGLMVIDAITVQSGLKLSTTVHTATGSDVTIKVLDGSGIDVNFGLPIPKQDLVTLKSEIFNYKRERGQSEVNTPLSFTTKRRDYHGCFDQLSPVVGLTFCTEVGFPAEGPSFNAAFFPLNGPAKVSVRADKDDDGMTGYRLRAMIDKKTPNKRSFEVLIDTPGSKTNRKLALTLEGSSSPDYSVKAALTSPWKKVSVEGQIVDNDQKQMLIGKLVNDKAEYSVKVGLDVTGSPEARTYAPVLEYSTPGRKESFAGKDGKKQPVNIEGTVTIEKKGDSYRKYKFNGIAVNTPVGKYGIDGTITKDTNLLAHDLKLILDKNTASLKTDLQKLGPTAYKAHIEAVPNQVPDFSFAIDWDYKRENNQVDHNLVVAHGANLKAVESRVTLNQQFILKGEGVGNFDVSTKQKLTYPLLGIDSKLDAAATRKTLSYDLLLKYDNKKLESKLNGKINQKTVGDYEITFAAKVNDKGIAISSQRSKPAADKVKAHHIVELTPGGKYELSSDVTYTLEKTNINYIGEHLLKLHQQPDIKASTAVVYQPGHFNSHCWITYGDTKYLDTSAKLDRNDGKPTGSYKIIIKDYFDSHGDLKYASGKGSGNFAIDIPKVGRKIKGSADLVVAGNNHKISADLLWNAEKDPKQKVHFETDSDISKQSINSKNTIILMDWKTMVNLKRELTGSERDGAVNTEVDITIPSGRRLSARYKREIHIKAADQPSSGECSLILEDHNGSAVRSTSLKVTAKGVDIKHGAFDANLDWDYKAPDGKDIVAKMSAKNVYGGDNKWNAEAKGSIKGAYLPQPAEIEFNTEVTKNKVTYKLKGNAISGFEYDIAGNVITGLNNADHRHADTTIELKLPSDYVKNIKIRTDWTLTAEVGSPCQVGFKHLLEMLEKIRTQKGMKLASAVSLLVPNLVPSCEVKAVNEITWNDKTAKLNGGLKADLRRGATRVILILPNDKPRSITTNWVHELDQEPPKLTSSVAALWEDKKEAKAVLTVEGLKDFSDITVTLAGTTQVDQKHNFEVKVLNKRKNDHAHITDVALSLDDKKLNVGVDLDLEDKHPKFDLKIQHSGGKLRVAAKTDRKSEKEVKNEGQIEWPYQGGGKLTWEFESKVESIDDFDFKGKIDSEKLNLNKYVITIGSKPGDKKQINFSCKSGDKNIISGSTNYQLKQEGALWTVEGSGNVQIKEEARSSHFKYTRKLLTQEVDKETGSEHKLNIDLGGKESIVIERTLTLLRNRFLHVYCNKDKKCARLEWDGNIKTKNWYSEDVSLKVAFDLKSLGVPHDLKMSMAKIREGRIMDVDFSLDMDTTGEKTSLSSKLYSHDSSAGLIVNLPKRTIELLAEVKTDGPIKAEITLWLDKKRQPNLKSAISLEGSLSQKQDAASLSGKASFIHPGAKEIAVSGSVAVGGPQNFLNAHIDLDVFADAKQKVVLEAKLAALQIPGGHNITLVAGAKSKGLALDVELQGHVAGSPDVISASQFVVYQDLKKGSRNAGVYAKLSKEKLVLVATVPGSVIVKIKSDLKIARDVQSIDSTIDLFGMRTIALQGEIKDLNSAIFNIYKKDDPSKKLSLKGGFGWGQVAEVRATKQDGNDKKDLFHVSVALDESHFLMTDYGGSYENVKATIDNIKKETGAVVSQARIQIADAVLEGNNNIREVAEEIKKAKPDLKPVIESYQKELHALADELASEKLAKEIADIVKEVVSRITAVLDKIHSELHKYVEILEKPLKQLSETLKQSLTKLNEVYGSIAEMVVNAAETIAQLIANQMSQLVELVRKHEEEIKKIATVVGQGIKDVGHIVSKAVGQIRHEVEDFVKLFMEQLKALPIYEVLKERYNELKKYQIPEQTWNVIHDMINALIASMPTRELSDLLQSISNYAEKRLKKEKVDDVAELKTILNNALLALKSILGLIKSQISQEDISKIIKFAAVPLPGASWFQLPIFAPIHFSPLKWLQSGEFPSLSDAYYTYRPTLNPLDWVPPYKMYGILVDSHNFYTFDRKYYNFKGACSYVLAQDFVDGNFSLIVNLEGGKFKSILLNDAKDSIELMSDMSILVNGKPQDFPALQGGLSAWRRYDSANLRSDTGVFVTCDLNRQVCQFFISGFYFGKTRGLLGNMNYEQFDDMILPNGKIASKIADFGNAWKVNAECNDVALVGHDHSKESNALCASYFGGSSPLSSCFPYINPAAFRTACELVTAEAKTDDSKKAACNLAFAYTQSCRYEHVKVEIPSACASCQAGSNAVAIGDSVSVKSPQTMADIVFVVEQITPNEAVFKDLVVPLISSVSNDLKAKGITDVHFSLVGFGAPNQKWPSHFTYGGELSFEGKTKNIWFGAPTTYEKSESVESQLKWIKHQIDLETGNLKLVDAFTEAGEYPFRAGAVKAIIGVMGRGCESSLLPISLMQVRTHLASYRYRDQGISLHVITPLDGLALDSDKPVSDIVGFDSEQVFILGDDKKKPFAGSTEQRDHLKNESDTCIKVALASYGSAFSSKNFLAAKPPQRKQFVSVVSKRVTESLAGGEITQDCKCSLHDGLHSKINCRVTNRTEKRHG